MEIKVITTDEYLIMFPNTMKPYEIEEFKRTTETTKVVKLKGTKKFRPIFIDSVGKYYIKGKNKVYNQNL